MNVSNHDFTQHADVYIPLGKHDNHNTDPDASVSLTSLDAISACIDADCSSSPLYGATDINAEGMVTVGGDRGDLGDLT